MDRERRRDGGGKHGHAVLPSLALPDEDLATREIDVLDPQAERLEKP